MRTFTIATLHIVTLLLVASSARADTYVSTPLVDASAPGIGVRGGSFGASGWTTVNPDDTIWFTITDPLESGAMSFDLSGLGECTANCPGDVDLFTLYQQPDGLAQPIDYSPGYRNNDMRVFVRMFQVAGDPVNGAMKMELAGCPVGDPYYNNTCPTDCTALDGIAYCNGGITDCGWDATHTYHFELDWGGGTMTYFRDGVNLGSVSYPSTFAPQPLVVQLGSPRNAHVTGSGLPSGVTFANLLVTGTIGSATPACDFQAPPPDAGIADAPCTDGSIGATEDSTTASWDTGVDPVVTDLNVEADASGNPDAIVYVAFPPSSYAAQATLTLHTSADVHAAGGSGQVCAVFDAWDETTITWANKPAVSSICSGDARSVGSDQDVTWDVTNILNSGATSFAIVSTDSDGAHYLSREAGGCAMGPHLLVVPGTPPVDAGSPEIDAGSPQQQVDSGSPQQQGDAGSQAPDAGAQIDRDAGAGSNSNSSDAGASARARGTMGVTSSCASANGDVLIALLALGLLRRRR